MKLNIKRTGMVIAASSVLLASNAMAADMADTDTTLYKFYGAFGIEAAQRKTEDGYKDVNKKSPKANDKSKLSFRDGGNRFGVTATKGMVTGKLEIGIKSINPTPKGSFGDNKVYDSVGVRHANIMIKLPQGGTIGIGQQSNLRISSGWLSNAWNYHSASIDGERAVNGGRYTGVSYVHDLQGKGSIGAMVGMSGAGDGSGSGDVKKKSTNLDKLTFRGTFQAMPELNLEVGFDQYTGPLDKNPEKKRAIAAAVTYSMDKFKAHAGFAQNKTEKGKVEKNGTALSVNGSFGFGEGMAVFGGFKTVNYEKKDALGKKVSNHSEKETSITVGVNASVLGAATYVAFDNIANKGGVKDAKVTDISAGIFYSF